MKQITFTITEDEIRNEVRNIAKPDLSDEQIQSVLDMVECDEMLWKDIHNSIVSAIHEL